MLAMERASRGFTLIELLVAMLVTLIILGALVMTFRTQYGLYKFQHRKADVMEDSEVVLEMLRDDLENALVQAGVPVRLDIAPAPPAGPTTDLFVELWEPDLSFWPSQAQAQAVQYRAVRHYRFVPAQRSLRLDRNINDGNDAPVEVLGDVVFFQVWRADNPPLCGNGQPYRDAPPAPAAAAATTYTVLLELEVPVGTRAGVKMDHCGNPTRAPRVLRYIQATPQARIEVPSI